VIRFANLPHQLVHRGFLRFLDAHFMHFRYFRDLRAFRLMAFTRDAFFSHEVSGGLRSFTFGGVGSAGRFCFRLAGSGLFSLCGCFFLVVLSGGFFLRSVAFTRWFFVQQNAAPAERRLPLA
jgi:hypothetical protein